MSADQFQIECLWCGEINPEDEQHEAECPSDNEDLIIVTGSDGGVSKFRPNELATRSLGAFGVDAESTEVQSLQEENRMVVAVTINGELRLNEVTQSQGRLLYCKHGIEVLLRGFRDGVVLLEIGATDSEPGN